VVHGVTHNGLGQLTHPVHVCVYNRKDMEEQWHMACNSKVNLTDGLFSKVKDKIMLANLNTSEGLAYWDMYTVGTRTQYMALTCYWQQHSWPLLQPAKRLPCWAGTPLLISWV